MSDAAAILADYADFRLIKTRKVMQIICEVPIEQAEEVTKRLGWPNPHEGVAVAVCLVDVTDEQAQAIIKNHERTKPKQRFDDKPRAAQAGQLCNTEIFQRFLRSRHHSIWCNALNIVTNGALPDSKQVGLVAAYTVRSVFYIESRAELNKDIFEGPWRDFLQTYRAYQLEQQHADNLEREGVR